MVKELLSVRKKIKAKTPRFVREVSHKHKEVSLSWRRPKGLHSKMRHNKKGHPKSVNVGFKGPVKVRGFSSSGLNPVLVSSLKDFKKLNKSLDAVIVGSKLGGRSKSALLSLIKESGFTVINLRSVDSYQNKLEEKFKASNEYHKQVLSRRKLSSSKSVEDKLKKTELSDDEKKKVEKAEKDKVLTQRE